MIKKGSKIWRMHYLHKCLQLLSMLAGINIAIRIGKDYSYCIDKVLINKDLAIGTNFPYFHDDHHQAEGEFAERQGRECIADGINMCRF